MTHPFMASVADGLAKRGVATLRYQFSSVKRGSKRPDKPVLAQATVRAAVAEAACRVPSLPLFAGGKSFGCRMTSQAQAEAALPAVQGLVFLGFPLHPAKKPSGMRAQHLLGIDIPMLFLEGTRDALADMTLLEVVVEKLGQRTSLFKVDDADHAYHVPKRSGRTDAEVLAATLDKFVRWIAATAHR